jgi:hypothetical protein
VVDPLAVHHSTTGERAPGDGSALGMYAGMVGAHCVDGVHMSDSSVFLGVIFSGTRRSDVMVRLLPHSDTNQPDLPGKQILDSFAA